MIGPWVVVNAIIHFLVRVAGTFCAELPYCPVRAMLFVKEFSQLIQRVAVGKLRVGA